jgi:hypothetical protein
MYNFLFTHQDQIVHVSRLIVGCLAVALPMILLYGPSHDSALWVRNHHNKGEPIMSRLPLANLCKPFPPEDIEWRVGNIAKSGKSCTLLAYITSRAVMDRFISHPELSWTA